MTSHLAVDHGSRAAQWLALAAVAWGAFAFGAVYPWGFWPLAAVSLAVGSTLLFSTRIDSGTRSAALPLAFAGVAIAIGVQLVPLPITLLSRITPATDDLLRRLDPVYEIGLTTWHPLSIGSADTWRGLLLFAAFSALVLGLSQGIARAGARRLVASLVVVAVLLALVGIIQKPLYTGAIYGMWVPEASNASAPFGPFVNRNHFAGWMLMALPLGLALFASDLQHGWHAVKPDWRSRFLWLSSPDASRLMLLAAAVAVMALALVMTMSRSGMLAIALATVLTAWSIGTGVPGRARKAAVVASLVILVVTVVAWVGAEVIVGRFAAANWREFSGRPGAWIDARSVAAAFPLTGTGLNTYAAAALVYQRHDLTQFYAQAHNDYLQLAAEGGLLLLVPIGVCLLVFVRDVRRRSAEDRIASTAWWLRRGAVTAMVAIALQETVEFSLQMPGNAVLFAVVCAIALHRAPVEANRLAPAASRRRFPAVDGRERQAR